MGINRELGVAHKHYERKSYSRGLHLFHDHIHHVVADTQRQG